MRSVTLAPFGTSAAETPTSGTLGRLTDSGWPGCRAKWPGLAEADTSAALTLSADDCARERSTPRSHPLASMRSFLPASR